MLIELSSQRRSGLRDVLEEILAEGLERGFVLDATICREPRAGQGVLAHPRAVRRGAAPRRRLHQARHISAGGRHAGVHRARRSRGREANSRRRPMPFGHSATATSITTSCSPPAPIRPQFLKRWDEVNDAVLRDRAEIRRLDLGRARHRRRSSATICRRSRTQSRYELMRTLKRTLDPKGILNPGKVL